MPFTVKDWVNEDWPFGPAANVASATPIDAESLEDMEARLSGYTDAKTFESMPDVTADEYAAVKHQPLYLDADPTGTVACNAALQAALDKLRDVPFAKLIIPPGEYRLTRASGTAYAAIHVWSNITIEGTGAASHIFLDPATTGSATRFYVMMIGDVETAASNVTIRNLKLTANNKTIGSGTINAIGARHDGANLLLHSDNVLVERCFIYDSQIAIGCHKNNPTIAEGSAAERLAAQFHNWKAINNYVKKTGNKAIELSECTNGQIKGNEIWECNDGPQLLFFCRGCIIADNWVSFYQSGINLASGITDSIVCRNWVMAEAGAEASGAGGSLQIRCEPTEETVITSGLRIFDNFLYNEAGTLHRVIRFFNQSTGSGKFVARDIRFRGNVLAGVVLLRDATAPSRSEIYDVWLEANTVRGTGLDTVAQATCAVSAVRFSRNEWEKVQTFKGSDCSFDRDVFKEGLVFAPESARNHITDGIEASAFTDEGTENYGSLADVRKPLVAGG